MNRTISYLVAGISAVSLCTIWISSKATNAGDTTQPEIVASNANIEIVADTSSRPKDGTPVRRSKEVSEVISGKIDDPKGVQLKNPSNLKSEVTYDPATNQYKFNQKIGTLDYRSPSTMSLEEYKKYEMQQATRNYWREKASNGRSGTGNKAFAPSFNVNSETFDKIFGSNAINVSLQGNAELIFGYQISTVENPTVPEKYRTVNSFNFSQKVQMNARGTIGERLKLGVEYNTEATFDFENKVKLDYSGGEDDIVKKIEAGNVNLPLSGSLISGSQSLFGFKTEMQFGKLNVVSVFSQQKGESSVMNVQGGAQLSNFEVKADDYEANRHFFISHYFQENFDKAMSNLPIINSDITITKIEVWVTNKTRSTNSRNIFAFMDLGEERSANIHSPSVLAKSLKYPDNKANTLISGLDTSQRDYNSFKIPAGFTQGVDYEKLQSAKMLQQGTDYTYDAKLGFISLNSALNSDEILAVAYQYTSRGQKFKVGEMSTEVLPQKAIVVKLLKGTSLTPSMPNWSLMMKNIYSLGAYQISNNDFTLNVLYQDDQTGNSINYLPILNQAASAGSGKSEVLLTALGLDHLNTQSQKSPDGMFDFIEGLTIYSQAGRIMFPETEPFGSHLDKYLKAKGVSAEARSSIVFDELYTETQTKAKLLAEKNKFRIAGSFKSSGGSEIMLNAMNVPQGSVKVTAGGRELIEGTDYSVDYTLGRVKIMNAGLMESGTPIKVSLENNSMFSLQTKTMIGSHLDYKFNDDLNIGATVLHLSETPLTKKVTFGDEPISNTIWGLNGTYKTNSQFLTKLIDKLPFIQTKETSSIMFSGEFAQLIPGSPSAIGKSGTSYIDDFEGSQTKIDLKTPYNWSLASIPQGQSIFPESSKVNDLSSGYNRALLAWYYVDPLFTRKLSTTPSNIKGNKAEQESPFNREVYEKELFPNKQSVNNIPTSLSILNLAFYPQQKGPYNFDAVNINSDGTLKNSKSRWGGIMREITSSDFESNNVEYIEFWMMDPYAVNTVATDEKSRRFHKNNDGELYFNLGNVSEDVLKDGRVAFENGTKVDENDTVRTIETKWGVIPDKENINPGSFSTASQDAQDVGLDGINDGREAGFFKKYLADLATIVSPSYLAQAQKDPANDDYHFFRGTDYDQAGLGILARYKKYNGVEGNSKTSGAEAYPTAATNIPNGEDINKDNTLSETESYFQYRVSLDSTELQVGQNYVTDIIKDDKKVKWYQFKIPINSYEAKINGIEDFKSIRFMRMFIRGVSDSVLLRFASLELVRGEWRKYDYALKQGSEDVATQPATDGFDVTAINIEENGTKSPVNYVLPKGLDRAIDPSNPQLRQMNEQSMLLRVNNLEDGNGKAVYKNVNLDLRQYKRLKMDMHGESLPEPTLPLKDGEVTVFVRIGSDFKNNYYEYEVPVKVTPKGSYLDNDADRLKVWPESNRFDIDLSILQKVKLLRNEAMKKEGSNISMQTVYPYSDGNNKVYVCGNPNLSSVRTIMIGIRNPKGDPSNVKMLGNQASAEIWVNELRLTDFNQKGGWAANARMQAKLADLGMVNVSGATSTAGWGSLDSKVNQRDKFDQYQYDVNTNLELGKFFPEKSGVSIPVYASFSEAVVTPEYNPLDPDVKYQDALNSASSARERDSISRISTDYTMRKSLNFTNVKIQSSSGSKTMPWSISNWSVSYGFNQLYSRNINTEYNIYDTYRGSLNYIYNVKAPNVQPLKKFKFLNSSYLRLFRDFNFYYLPSNFSFRTDMLRNYRETKVRNINTSGVVFEPTVNKDFTWNRIYDLKFDLTRSLKFDMSATNTAYIDERPGVMNKSNKTEYEMMKDTIWKSIRQMGRTTNYIHQFNVTYNTPLNKLPGLDWTSLNLRYRGDYGWEAAPKDYQELGNTLTNSSTMQYSGNLNLRSLYNKVPYLRKLDQEDQNRSRGNEKKKMIPVNYTQKFTLLRAGKPRSVTHNLGVQDVKVTVKDASGAVVAVTADPTGKDKVRIKTEVDVQDAVVVVEGQVPEKENLLLLLVKGGIRMATSVQDISINYTVDGGTYLPGYTQSTKLFGSSSAAAPGIPFILGIQDDNFDDYLYDNNWSIMSKDLQLASASYKHQNTFNARTTLEPLPDFKIELQVNRAYSRVINRYYNPDIMQYDNDNEMISGNFSMSVWSFNSAFEKIASANNYSSAVFNQFRNNISTTITSMVDTKKANSLAYANMLTAENPNYGFKSSSQQVMLSAFMSTYLSGSDAKKTAQTDVFDGIEKFNKNSLAFLRPNWRITYDGLSKISLLQAYIQNITLTHSYNSSFSISSFTTNSDYIKDDLTNIDANGNFYPKYDIGSVSLVEQLSPLLGFDINWKNSLTNRIEYRQSRSVALSFSNSQVMEVLTKEWVLGFGYRFDQLPWNVISAAGTSKLSSDLNLRLDFTIRDDKTVLRKLVEGYDDITDGKKNFKVSFSADYQMSDKFTMRLFFDRIVNTPFVSRTYKTANTNFGFSVRFQLM